MKTKGFIEQVRQAAKLNRELVLPEGYRTQRSWPLCLTCGREVSAVELKNVNSTSVEIWARCHGKEDYYKVVFPYRVDGDPLEDERANWAIKRALHDFCPFNPADVPK